MPYDTTEFELRNLRRELSDLRSKHVRLEGEQSSQKLTLSMMTTVGIVWLILAVVSSITVSVAIAEDRCESADDPQEQPGEADEPTGPR